MDLISGAILYPPKIVQMEIHCAYDENWHHGLIFSLLPKRVQSLYLDAILPFSNSLFNS